MSLGGSLQPPSSDGGRPRVTGRRCPGQNWAADGARPVCWGCLVRPGALRGRSGHTSVQKLLTTQVQTELLNFISQKMTMMILTSDYCFSSSLLQGTERACEAWKARVLGVKTLAQTCRLDFLGLGDVGGLDPLSQRPLSASFGASHTVGQPQGYGA